MQLASSKVKNSSVGEVSPIVPFESRTKRQFEERKRNGIFYSPENVISILTKWAIQDPTELILEPSFGGCGFLLSSSDRLISLNNLHPEENLFGCDIDDAAFDILRNLFQEPDTEQHFIKRDFLTVSADQFPLVDVVIGNPPYISWHNMPKHQRQSAALLADAFGISRNASLWMYFVLKSLSFMKEKGRMAWILPGSFVFTDYSVRLRQILSSLFGRSIAVFLEERIFLDAGTEESTVILLCEGFKSNQKAELQFTSVRDVTNLGNVIENWRLGGEVGITLPRRPQSLMVPKVVYDTFQQVGSDGIVKLFGELASVKIGLVTGANRFFILDDKEINSHCLPREFIDPIFAKFSHHKGVSISKDDLSQSQNAGQRCLFVNCRKATVLPDELTAYLESFPKEKRESNYTFNNTRAVWYHIDDEVRPDGFFSAMQSGGPCLVLNFANTTCTNTIYQVTFSKEVSDEVKKVIAIAIQSTYGQFSAELEGRVRGGGALKLEPSEVKRLKILVPAEIEGINSVFDEVDLHLRNEDRGGALDAADDFFVSKGIITWNEIRRLREGVKMFRSIRYGHR